MASVPATHVYVRRLAHPGVCRLRDPSGDDLRTPRFLGPHWLRAHAGAFDLVHVHFGFEFYSAARLEAVCGELRRQGVPLVYTCHDLRNPNHSTAALHDAALAVWMAHADAVVTLTDWAAREIKRRFGRRALVLPHPHVVPLKEMRARQTRPRPRHRDRYRIGIHFKSLRANMVGAPLLHAALGAVAPLDGVRLRIDLHADVADPRSANHDAALMALALGAAADAASDLDLHIHHYFSDDELWAYLATLDAFALPYRFGTHSGLLEACRDLGTAVIAPSCGAYGAQGAHYLYKACEAGGVGALSVAAACRAAAEGEAPAPLSVAERQTQRQAVAEAHHQLYRRLLR